MDFDAFWLKHFSQVKICLEVAVEIMTTLSIEQFIVDEMMWYRVNENRDVFQVSQLLFLRLSRNMID